MSSEFGVVSNFTTSSARPITAESITPGGIAGIADGVAPGLYSFGSPEAALADAAFAAIEDGPVAKTLNMGKDFNIITPTIVSVANTGADAVETEANIIAAINALKTAEAEFGYRPDVLAAPDHTSDIDVAVALVNAATGMLARCYTDLAAANEADAITEIGSFSSMRHTPCGVGIKYGTGTIGGSALAFWVRILVDSAKETGWADSASNRGVNISGTDRPIEFIPGSTCEADRLRAAGIWTVIRYKGFRTWGEKTMSADPIWEDARRVRIFDRMVEATLDGIFWAVDRDLNMLDAAKRSIRSFLNGLVGANVLLGFKIYLDEERTTITSITEGKFYFIVETQEMPVARRIEVTYDRVDTYASVVYDILSA